MKVLIATHKPYQIPDEAAYYPIMVGADLRDQIPAGYLKDNTGKNMSKMNPFYNELTALYWAKNNLQDEDIIGLVHYRRYLGSKGGHDLNNILSEAQIRTALKKVDVLLPKQRNYYIESQKNHYLNAHKNEPYFVMADVIKEKFPTYYEAFITMGQSKRAHLFNMSIMNQENFQSYTSFMFDVLDEVEKRIPYREYEGQEQRVFGFLSERLMDTWLYTKQKTFAEYPIITTEKTNWIDKGTQFLKRKFFKNGRKKVHF